MDKERLLAIVQTILREPTAPFHEAAVRGAIAGLLRDCPGVSLREDGFGNLIAHYRGGDAGAPKGAVYAFCAHMDHPGWVRPEPAGPERWRFLGGVPGEYLEANRERIREFGDFAMWDLPAYELHEDCIRSRACDDLIGCAAIVATLEMLGRLETPGECYGLFTRGEEVGFAGAIHLARDGGWLAEAGLTVISLETSAERAPATLGDGPIVRVGDKTSMFDPAVTAELTATATAARLTFQRCLMSGGTCEATAFRLYGIRCGALCVALGNYHNCGPHGRIEAEYVSQADVEGLVRLCVEVARRGSLGAPDADAALRGRLRDNLPQYEPYFFRDRHNPTDYE